MITFEIKRHIEIDENHQGINLTEFLIEDDNNTDTDQIVETFIHSTNFSVDSLRDVVKNSAQDKPYLRQAFDMDRIQVTDFRRQSKEETTKFLVNFMNQSDLGDEKNDFMKLCDKYFEIHNPLLGAVFYVISKDWFDKGDERVVEPESWIYTYYFLLISVDRREKSLTLTEWTFD